MRVAITLQSLHHFGGIGIYTQQIVKHLLELDKKNEYVLIFPSFGQAHKSLGWYREYPNATEILTRSLFPHGYYWDHFVVPHIAKRFQADLVFNPFISVPLFGNFKKVFVVHGCEWFLMPEVFWFAERMAGKFRMKLFMSLADRVISVSKQISMELIRGTGLPADKFRVVHNAAAEQFKPVTDAATLKLIKAKYNLPAEYVLFVGGIYPQKNFGALLEAFAAVLPATSHHLVVAGDLRWKSAGDYRKIKQLKLNGRVRMLGWVSQEDLPAIYSLATCFVLPSLYESCSVALLEAVSCGCPIVASNTGGNPEVLGDAGILVDPANTPELTSALSRILFDANLRNRLSRKAADRAKHFGWQKAAAETLRVFEEIE